MTDTNNPFENSELTSILVVNNLDKALPFYTEILQAELIRTYGGTSAVLKFLNNWLLLVTPGDPTEDKPEVYFKPSENINSVHHAFTIRVTDCQHSYEILKERGAQFITPPYDWGMEIRCFFRDVDGNLFEISEFTG